MNIDTQAIEPCQLKLTVEVDAERLQRAKQAAARKLSGRLNIPGFRKGKAPYAVVVNQVGEAAVTEQAVDSLGSEIYKEALELTHVEPSATGELVEIAHDPLKFTFVNRNLEPYRGYHIFMRALPEILKRRPKARVLIVGGDDISYGAKPEASASWKTIFANEVRPTISDEDWARVYFLGNIPYRYFIPLLQLSTVHVYLTYPFVLSWSLLEAMSVGCAIVASDTQPLHEAITQDQTGRLVNFFDVQALSTEVCGLLDDPASRQRLGHNARAFAQQHYDLRTSCLPRQVEWVEQLGEA